MIVAADVQAEQAEQVVAQVRDEAAQIKLRREMAELRADRQARRFHVVVFGTGSAGKTSLINALLGSDRRPDRGDHRHHQRLARRSPTS